VNHDGRADVVVGNSGSNIQVFLQNASGGLDPGVSYPTANSHSIKIGDLNNDGLLDVIGCGASSVDVFLQSTNGTLNPPVTYGIANGSCAEVDIGDVNGDGLNDIIVMGAQSIGVLFQKPDGTFSAPVYYDLGGNQLIYGVAVGDVNGDGLQDIVVTYGGNRPSSKIGVFLQNKAATLDPAISYDSYDIPRPVVIADMNNDGKQDVIMAHDGWDALGVYLQGPTGSLLPEELYPVPFRNNNPQSLAVGDINGDGFNDVVLADPTNGLLVLYSKNGPAIPRIDVLPLSVNFGSTFLGNSSSTNIYIYNRGTGSLIINVINITGPNATEFSQQGDCSNVAPGGNCMITATVTPASEGIKKATLMISSNDPDTPVVQVTFFAYGGQPLFYPYVNFPVGSWPEAVAIGDVNGDGRNDVAMTTSYNNDPENDYHLFVFLQDSSGILQAPIKYPINASYTNRPTSIAIGDVNHDGRADVVVSNCGSNIEVFLQNASGGLDPGVSYPTANSRSIKIGDLNNDGLLDVVGCGGGSVDVFFQNINGTLNPPVTYSIINSSCTEVDIGDVNNDGLNDIIVIGIQGVDVLFQQPGGTFSAPVHYNLPENELPVGVAIGDVNGDGLQDIVVTYGGNRPDSKIGVFLQSPAGTLQPAMSYDSYDIPEPVVIADLNNDGKQDVIVAHGGWDALGVYLQGQDGSLMPEELYAIPYASHYNPQGLAVGDINGDGYDDVVIADNNNGLVVLYSKPAQPEIISTPTTPSGSQQGIINVLYAYSTGNSVSSLGHPVEYFLDWGDGTNTGWLPVGTTTASKSWTKGGTYSVKAQARCANHNTVLSAWSDTLSVIINSVGISVVGPNGGETFTAGSTQTIRWSYAGNPGAFVKIELLKAGVVNRTIASFASKGSGGGGSHNWTIPTNQAPGTDYRVRVTSTSKRGYTDMSDSDFSIAAPTITVVSPNGGETLTAGSTQTIRWSYSGNPGAFVKIELLKGGMANRTIASFASKGSGGSGSHNWHIPSTQVTGLDYRIRISTMNGSYTDTSDNDFTIGK